jgi:protein TonB
MKHAYKLFLVIAMLLLTGTAEAGDGSRGANMAARDTIPEFDSIGDKVFQKVEIEASYPGGDNAWRKYLERNLDGTVPTRRKAPAGTYTVVVQFVVDKTGKVTSIKPLTQHGFGMEEEVIRLLEISPRWKPAVQGGRNVKAYRKQPVTFMVEEKRKRKKNE